MSTHNLPSTAPDPADGDRVAALTATALEALDSLDDLCRDEDTHGSSIRAHEVREAVADLRAQVTE